MTETFSQHRETCITCRTPIGGRLCTEGQLLLEAAVAETLGGAPSRVRPGAKTRPRFRDQHVLLQLQAVLSFLFALLLLVPQFVWVAFHIGWSIAGDIVADHLKPKDR